MKSVSAIITQIVNTIFENDYEQIEAQSHQDLMVEIANSYVNKNDFIRAGKDISVIVGEQTISFSSSLPSSEYSLSIYDPQGLGIEFKSQSSSGFTIYALNNGTINYQAIITI